MTNASLSSLPNSYASNLNRLCTFFIKNDFVVQIEFIEKRFEIGSSSCYNVTGESKQLSKNNYRRQTEFKNKRDKCAQYKW